jgi:AhpD family alkylhydroperoxidase
MENDMLKEFRSYRQKMNDRLLALDNTVFKRIFNLDTNSYLDGALSARVKEMLGLVSSMVLRCDDCVRYHLEKCREHEMSTDEVLEVFAVANLVGGTIVIPHTRRALEYWEALLKEE